MVDNILLPNPITIGPDKRQPKPQQQRERTGGAAIPFDKILEQKLPDRSLKFSQHAQDRLKARGITIDAAEMGLLTNAVDSVAQKGGKESLIMLGDAAFVVSVKNRTVVTALDRSQMRGNVFTNIDSAVVF